MRKMHFVLFVVIVFITALMIPVTFAQEVEISTGCDSLSSATGINDTSMTDDFFAGEKLTFELVGALPGGSTWTVTINAVDVLVDSDGDSFSYIIPVDGEYTIATDTSTDDFEIGLSCIGVDEDGEIDDFTLCHYPPGNPAAAHTITVGSQNAFNTHLGHGDSPGACAEGTNTRADDIGGGLVFFIILDRDGTGDVTEVISILGLCENGECASIVDIMIEDVVLLVGTLEVNGYVVYDADDDDNYEFRIYYLGYQDRNGDGNFQHVYQINVYYYDVLNNDDVLILVHDDGGVSWTLNADLGVDISILFISGDDDSDDDDSGDECDADGADDIEGNEDDEVCEPSS